MKKVFLMFEVENDFKIGECVKCPFHMGTQQCIVEDKLTNGTCKLNCFCRLVDKGIVADLDIVYSENLTAKEVSQFTWLLMKAQGRLNQ